MELNESNEPIIQKTDAYFPPGYEAKNPGTNTGKGEMKFVPKKILGQWEKGELSRIFGLPQR